jgi:hypothetical protein
MPVGRKRSLFFEFIALQREVRFTDNPTFEKVGTGSGFWKKNQKARFKSCVLRRCPNARPAQKKTSATQTARAVLFIRAQRLQKTASDKKKCECALVVSQFDGRFILGLRP